jgi:hypothetical protein
MEKFCNNFFNYFQKIKIKNLLNLLDGKLVVGSFQYKIPDEMKLYLVKI